MDDLKIPFDKRIDQIGLAAELVKLYADPLKPDVKASMNAKDAERAEGELFDAMLVNSETRSIEPEKLLHLFEKKKIDRDHFLSALKVNIPACEKFLSKEVVDGLSTKEPSQSLRISRKKGVALVLMDCIRGISESVMPKKKAA